MVGVCLTVIGILNIIMSVKQVSTFGDEITAVDALLFLAACFSSYISLKTKNRKHRLIMERISDGIFLCGLSVMAIVCIFIVYKLI